MAEVGFKATADMAGFVKGMAQYVNGLNQMQADTAKTTASMTKGFSSMTVAVGTALGNLATKAIGGFVGLLKSSVSTAFEAYGAYERLGMSLESLLAKEMKTADAALDMNSALAKAKAPAKDLLGWVQQLAIISPFEASDISGALKTAMAYGITSDKAKELTANVVDYAAASGATGETINRVVFALGKVQAQGKLTGETIMQLTEAGVGVQGILKRMGVSLDQVSKGAVSADAFLAEFNRTISSDFGGAAKRQAATFSGLTSTLKDLKTVGLREFFAGTFQAMQPFLAGALDKIATPETFKKLNEIGNVIGQKIGGALQAVQSIIQRVGPVLGSLSEIWKGAFAGEGVNVKWLTEVLGTLGLAPGIAAGAADAFSRITDALGPLTEVIKGGLSGEGVNVNWLSEIFQNLGAPPDLSAFAAGISGGLLDAIAQVKAGDIGGAFQSIFTSVDWGAMMRSITDSIFGFLRDGLGKLGEAFPDIKPLIDGFIKPFLDMGQTVYNAVGDVKGTILKDLLGTFQSVLPALQPILSDLGAIFKQVIPIVIQTVQSLLPIVRTVFQTAGDVIESLLPIVQVVVDGIRQLIPCVGQVIQAVLPIVQNVVGTIAKLIQDNMPMIQALIGKVIGFIVANMPLVMDILQDLQPVIAAALDAIQRAAPIVLDIVSGVINALMIVIETGLKIIHGIINAVMAAIKGDWQGAWQEIQGVGQTLLDGLVKLFGNLAATFGKIGDDIVAGFLGGLKGKWAEVKDWVQEAASKLPKWMKDILGIKSPSTVFYEIGRDIMLGLAQGLGDAEREAILKMAEVVNALVSAFTGFAALGGMTGNLNITRIKDVVGQMVAAVQEVAKLLSDPFPPGSDAAGILNHAKDVAGQVSQIMSVYQSMFEGFKALSEFVPGKGDVSANLKSVLDLLPTLISGLAEAINALSDTADEAAQLTNAAAFGPMLASVVTVLQPALDAVKSIADFMALKNLPSVYDAQRATAQLVTYLYGIAQVLNQFARPLPEGQTIYEIAKRFYEALASTVGWLNQAVGAVKSIAEFMALKNLPGIGEMQPAVARLVTYLYGIAAVLRTFAVALPEGETIYDVAKRFYEALASTVGWLSQGIGAVKSIADFMALKGLPTVAEMQPFAAKLVTYLYGIARVLASFALPLPEGETIYDSAKRFYDALAGTVGWLSQAVGAVQTIADFMTLKNLPSITQIQPAVAQLVTYIYGIAQVLRNLALPGNESLFEAAGKFYAAMSSVLSIIKPAIDAVINIVDFMNLKLHPGLGNLHDTAWELMQDLIVIARAFAESADTANTDLYAAASKLYAAMGGILAIVKPSIDAILAIVDYKPDTSGQLREKARNLVANLFYVIGLLDDIRLGITQKGMEAAGAMAEAAGKLIALVKPAIDAIVGIKSFVMIPPTSNFRERARNLFDNMTYLIGLFDDVRTKFREAGRAADYVPGVTAVLGLAKVAIDTIALIQNYKPGGASLDKALAAFSTDLGKVLDALLKLPTTANKALTDLLPFWKTAWAEIKSPIDAATKAIYDFIHAYQSIPPGAHNLPGPRPFGPQPGPPIPIVQQFLPAQLQLPAGGGGAVYNQQFTLGPFNVSSEMDLVRVRQVIRQELAGAIRRY